MTTIISILTTIILAVTMIAIWRTYREKSLLHPGLYFCCLWIPGVLSFMYINTFHNKYNVINQEYVNELNVYISFTAVLFFLFKNYGRYHILKNISYWKIYSFLGIYKIFSISAFFSALILFIIQGATLDLLSNRNNMVDSQTSLFYGDKSQDLLTTVLGSFNSINLLLAIFSGFIFSLYLVGKAKKILNYAYIFLPLFTHIVFMITVGGRNDLVWVLRCYIFGMSIGLSNGLQKKMYKKIIIIFAVIVSMFLLYSNFNIERRKDYIDNIIKWEEKPLVKPFSSAIEYFSSVYVGYQLRRGDFVTDELEYGEKTFSGILFLDIPFSGVLGLKNSSIGEVLGFEKYTMKKMFIELQKKNAAWFSTVSSMYLLLFDDFGYYGTFFVIFLFVWTTQIAYIEWFKYKNKSFFSIYFLFLFFCLWSNSIFDPVFATGNVRTFLISISVLQLSVYVKRLLLNKVYFIS